MTLDIRTAAIEPVRDTFDHIRDRLGPGKLPTRYQEGVFDLQPAVNFHYRPTWQPDMELYDRRRTAVEMADFDQLLDPRQYYYGSWTIARAKQQESQEGNFSFVEKRDLLAGIEEDWREKIQNLVIPVRHVAWAANTNNCYIAAYGFGAAVTSAASFQMSDELGVAQYISRIGLIMAGNTDAVLDAGKQQWMEAPMWQPMRRLAEDSMCVKDWFELHVLQNFLVDGMVHQLVFDRFDADIARHGGAAFSMLTEFMVSWYAEASRWTDAVMKVAAAESDQNRAQIDQWLARWLPRVTEAVQPLAEYGFGAEADTVIADITAALDKRAGKIGLSLSGGAPA